LAVCVWEHIKLKREVDRNGDLGGRAVMPPLLVFKALPGMLAFETRLSSDKVGAYLQLYRQDIGEALDVGVTPCLLCRIAVVAAILAPVRFDVLLVQTVVEAEGCRWLAGLFVALLGQAVEPQAQVQK